MNKTCTKCGRELPATREFFQPDARQSDGFRGACKACISTQNQVYNRAHYAENREEIKARSRAWSSRNAEKARAVSRASHLAHRDERNARQRAHYLANCERIKADSKQYRRNAPGVVFFREWRSRGCRVCGENDFRCIQSHHVDPREKEFTLARIRNLDIVVAELAKCVPLCANHHILVHEELRNGHKDCALDEVIEYLKEMSHV